jgi:hypothetical protein
MREIPDNNGLFGKRPRIQVVLLKKWGFFD